MTGGGLRTGKAEQAVLYNSVINRLQTFRPELLSRINEANDGAVFSIGPDVIVSTGVLTEDIDDKCFYAFYRALNNAAAAKAEPIAFFTSIIFPEGTGRDTLKAYSDRFGELAAKENACIAGGHTEVSDAVSSTVISVTCIGRPAESHKGDLPDPGSGLSIIMTKYAGLEGTAIIAHEKETVLKDRFAGHFVDDAKSFKKMVPAVKDARAALLSAPVIMHDASKGGVLSALWDIAAAYECGLDIDMQAIPIKQETVEICELFGLNPYELISGGAMLVLASDSDEKAVAQSLTDAGIRSAVIGKTCADSQKILRSGETAGCMNRPSKDALLYALRERSDKRADI